MGLLPDRLRALRARGMPHQQAEVEDGQGDRRQEDGGPPLPQVQRDGSVQLPAAAAARVRHLQELRGPVARGFHGRQRRCDAWQGHLLRAQGGGRRRRQEEVSASSGRVPSVSKNMVEELKPEVPGNSSKAGPPQCLSMAWSADGQTLFAGYSDNQIRVWQVSISSTR